MFAVIWLASLKLGCWASITWWPPDSSRYLVAILHPKSGDFTLTDDGSRRSFLTNVIGAGSCIIGSTLTFAGVRSKFYKTANASVVVVSDYEDCLTDAYNEYLACVAFCGGAWWQKTPCLAGCRAKLLRDYTACAAARAAQAARDAAEWARDHPLIVGTVVVIAGVTFVVVAGPTGPVLAPLLAL